MQSNRNLLLSACFLLVAWGLAMLPVERRDEIDCTIESSDPPTGTQQTIRVRHGDAQWLVADGDRVRAGEIILRMFSARQHDLLTELIERPPSWDRLVAMRDQLDPGPVKSWLTDKVSNPVSSDQHNLVPNQLAAMQSNLQELGDSLAILRALQYHQARRTPEVVYRIQSLESRQNFLRRQIDQAVRSTEQTRSNHRRVWTRQMQQDLLSVAHEELSSGLIQASMSGTIRLVPSKDEDAFIFRIDSLTAPRYELIMPLGEQHVLNVQQGDTVFFQPDDRPALLDDDQVPLVIVSLPEGLSSHRMEVLAIHGSEQLKMHLNEPGKAITQRSRAPWRLGTELVRR